MAIRRNLSFPLAASAFDGPDKAKKKKKGNGKKTAHAGYYSDAREAAKLMGKKPKGKLDTSYSWGELEYDVAKHGFIGGFEGEKGLKDSYATTDYGTREYKRIQDVKRARKKKKAKADSTRRAQYKANRKSLDNY